jgi:ketosteroid isomerase-like protein
VSRQKAIVEKYTEGFRRGDLPSILSCLHDDVVWALHGEKTMTGKPAFADEADNHGSPTPELVLDRLIEEGDTVVAVGHGNVDVGTEKTIDFVYSEVFTFTGGLVSRLDTFHVWLGELPKGRVQPQQSSPTSNRHAHEARIGTSARARASSS